MAASFVKATGNFAATSSTTLAVSYSSAVAAGNLLVCKAQCDFNTTLAVSDSVNGAWTALGTRQFLTGAGSVQLFYRQNTGAGTPTVTMTTGVSTGYRNLIIGEWAGIAAVALDTGTANGATGTSAAPAVIVTTVTDHDLVVAAVAVANTGAAGGGMNSRAVTDGNVLEDVLDKTPAGAQSMVFTQAPSGAWAVVGAGFLASVAADVMPDVVMAPRIPTY